MRERTTNATHPVFVAMNEAKQSTNVRAASTAGLMEGGAVHMQALVSHKFPVSSIMGHTVDSYNSTYEFLGGRQSSIIDHTIRYYASTIGKTHGLKAGEDRCCGDSCGAGLTAAQLTEGGYADYGGALYYDTGAVAVAWAIKRSGKTSAQFWTSPEEGKGFWNAITVSSEWDYLTGHASQVKEGAGWKKAFTAFTGDANMAAFYAAFDAWAATATKTDMLAVLETDAAIQSQMGVNAAISSSSGGSSPDGLMSAQGQCLASSTPDSSGGGGGPSAASNDIFKVMSISDTTNCCGFTGRDVHSHRSEAP
jgi:hypothetical protein